MEQSVLAGELTLANSCHQTDVLTRETVQMNYLDTLILTWLYIFLAMVAL